MVREPGHELLDLANRGQQGLQASGLSPCYHGAVTVDNVYLVHCALRSRSSKGRTRSRVGRFAIVLMIS